MTITKHAAERIKERFPQYSFWQIYGLAEEAIKYGVSLSNEDQNKFRLNDIIFIIYGRRKNTKEYPRLISCWPQQE